MAAQLRTAVFGASGFIGSHLVARLKAQGHWVRAIDSVLRQDRRDLYGQADEVDVIDLRSPVHARLALTRIDRVYHLAADHGGAGYFHSEHDQPAARNNMRIDLNVLDACERNHVERLFYASSFCAYPIDLQDDYADALGEELLYEGQAEQNYGMEKRMMTHLCESATFDARCGVFATIYGPGQESEGIRAKFPTAIVRRALESDGGPIELWGDGTQMRTFLYIDDALDRIQTIMDSDRYEGPVNVASDEQVTVLQCAKWACHHAGAPPVFDFRSDMPTGVQVRIPDNSKFKRLYGDEFSQLPTCEGFRSLSEWIGSTMLEGSAA